MYSKSPFFVSLFVFRVPPNAGLTELAQLSIPDTHRVVVVATHLLTRLAVRSTLSAALTLLPSSSTLASSDGANGIAGSRGLNMAVLSAAVAAASAAASSSAAKPDESSGDDYGLSVVDADVARMTSECNAAIAAIQTIIRALTDAIAKREIPALAAAMEAAFPSDATLEVADLLKSGTDLMAWLKLEQEWVRSLCEAIEDRLPSALDNAIADVETAIATASSSSSVSSLVTETIARAKTTLAEVNEAIRVAAEAAAKLVRFGVLQMLQNALLLVSITRDHDFWSQDRQC